MIRTLEDLSPVALERLALENNVNPSQPQYLTSDEWHRTLAQKVARAIVKRADEVAQKRGRA